MIEVYVKSRTLGWFLRNGMRTNSKLRDAFRITSKDANGEIELFRALIDAFDVFGSEALSKEYHGSKYQVVFQQSRGAGRSTPRCELCDVMIISYRRGDPSSARLTFNQVKLTKNAFKCFDKIPKPTRFKFRANLEQWDLLAHRPDIKSASRHFQPPEGLLSKAYLDSVGTFGVFYPIHGGFDYAYFIANKLFPLNNNLGREGTLAWADKPELMPSKNGCEVTSTCCLSMFEIALNDNLIGTPVKHTLASHSDSARTWLAGLLAQLELEHPESELPRELIDGLDLRPIADNLNARPDQQFEAYVRAAVLVRTPTSTL